MRTLLVDNHDSFTYNLFHLLARVNGEPPVVLRNDDHAGWHAAADVDNIVISPGPGRPDRERDFGISRLALGRHDVPVLGICLGHQGLCRLAGATVTHAPEPVHGRLSPIHHDGTDLFRDIPSPFPAVRYHSLIATDLPPDLEITATTADGLIMAVRHRTRPHWGVQFHPESIATEHGVQLLTNFRDRTGAPSLPRPTVTIAARTEFRHRLHTRTLCEMPAAATIFEHLFAGSGAAFWLDSSDGNRFSILGAACELATYDVTTRTVTVTDDTGRVTAEHDESLFDYLARELTARRVPDAQLPCDFNLGYVGYLGYEMKADCGATAAHRSAIADGRMAFADRAVVIDHHTDTGWLLSLDPRWLDEAERALRDLPPPRSPAPVPDTAGAEFRPWHDPAEYQALIRECQRLIGDGETYEVCLTNQLEIPAPGDPLRLYEILRRINPAPYAAYLAFPDCAILSSSPERFLTIDQSGTVESKPIKGTRPRGTDRATDLALAAELRAAEKDRAENLMIVDLVRHDLGRTAEIGSVHVPVLFDVESYPTVHQLVSTVRARLRADLSVVDCVRAAFPGGSMTGAPKSRTMEIIDRLEGRARGVYSGALGYFSLNNAVDLSIVIRTMVVRDGVATVGVGGAIVAGSRPDDEVAETMIKARAPLRALAAARSQLAAH